MNEIKDRVAQSRRDMGLTQLELAKRVGVSQQAIQQLEDGVIKRPRYMVELALALGVSPEWLLNGLGLKNPNSKPRVKFQQKPTNELKWTGCKLSPISLSCDWQYRQKYTKNYQSNHPKTPMWRR